MILRTSADSRTFLHCVTVDQAVQDITSKQLVIYCSVTIIELNLLRVMRFGLASETNRLIYTKYHHAVAGCDELLDRIDAFQLHNIFKVRHENFGPYI